MLMGVDIDVPDDCTSNNNPGPANDDIEIENMRHIALSIRLNMVLILYKKSNCDRHIILFPSTGSIFSIWQTTAWTYIFFLIVTEDIRSMEIISFYDSSIFKKISLCFYYVD